MSGDQMKRLPVRGRSPLLVFAGSLVCVAALLAVLYLLSVFVQKLLGFTVEGWATIMVAMLFLGSVQLICLGILGEYLGRIFNEVKPRPMYVVEEVRSSDGGRSS